MEPKAYSYKRFSSGNQKISSIERQEKVLADAQKWCEENGIPLDTSLSYVDMGVSSFHGQNRDTGALGDFLKAIESGKVGPGDYLIVEELSRLTRMEINDAQELFLSIVNRGVKIVSLVDRKVFSRDADPSQMMMDLIISISMLAASHLESFRKSKRGKEFYQTIRRDMENGVVKTHMPCPWWLDKERDAGGNTTFRVIEERAEVIREIFQLAAVGKGPSLISQSLPKRLVDRLPGKNLVRYCQYILRNRTVIGYYQPQERVYVKGRAKRQPVGEEVKIYPAIIEEKLWYKVQDIRATRHKARDFKLERVANVFGNLLKCCECGTTLRLSKSKSYPKNGKYAHIKTLNQYLHCPKSYSNQCGFLKSSYTVIEPILLEHIRGLDANYLLGNQCSTKSQQWLDTKSEAQGKLNEIQKKIDNLLKHLEDSPELDSVLLGRISELKKEMEEWRTKSKEADNNIQSLARNTETDIHALIDAVQSSPENDELRGKLKAELQRLIDRIEVRETKLFGQQQYTSKIPVCLKVHYRNGNVQMIVTHADKRIVLEANETAGVAAIESSDFADSGEVVSLIEQSADADRVLRGRVCFSPRVDQREAVSEGRETVDVVFPS